MSRQAQSPSALKPIDRAPHARQLSRCGELMLADHQSVPVPRLFIDEAVPLLVSRERWAEHGSRVYFVECNSRFIKIGWTSDFFGRLTALQSASPYRLRVAAVLHADRAFEQAVHSHFEELRFRGEWFTLSGALYQFLTHPAVQLSRGVR